MISQDLKTLEERSIYIIREAKLKFKNIAALWSMGKDSTTMLALTRKAFLGKIPFPVIHIDNGIDFPETYAFREQLAKKWNFKVIVGHSDIKPDSVGSACCGQNKPETLKKIMKEYGFDALIVSIRRDEHGIRAKERFFCFPKGTLVYGQEIKRIEAVKVGDLVYTHTGALRPVKGVSTRMANEAVLAISPRYGIPLITTPNHEILAKSNSRKISNIKNTITSIGFDGVSRQITLSLGMKKVIRWYHASELKVGDEIFIPKLNSTDSPTLTHIEIDKFIGNQKGMHTNSEEVWWDSAHSNSPRNKRVVGLSAEVMRLFGYYVAEGSCNSMSNQISLAFNLDEMEIAKEVLNTFKIHFGANGTIRIRTENGISVDVNSRTLTLLFPLLFGRGAHNKTLPYFFNELSTSQISELIKACWIGDGHAEKFSTTSKLLAHQIRLALLKLGILSSLKRYGDGRYAVVIVGLSKTRFTDKFGIEAETPYAGKYNTREVSEVKALSEDITRSRVGGFWVPIEKIEKTKYTGPVYDLNIEGDSSYLTEGIAVHNSPRNEKFEWKYKNQPAELWDDYSSKLDVKGHIRVHPLLDWNEIDIWRYIKQEKIPINPLYFSKNGFRYRSLGCTHCTVALKSNAKTVDDIIKELETTKVEERSGRSMDKEREMVMQRLRALGYM